MSDRHSGCDARSRLRNMSAEELLDRFPVPMIAILDSGEIVRANPSFDATMGHGSGYSTGQFIQSLFTEHTRELASAYSALEYLRQSYGHVIGFRYRDGSVVHAIVGLPVELRPLLLVAFHDVTEQLWSQTIATTLGSLTLSDG